MSIGSFTLIRNEAPWIAAHLLSWLPRLSEMVFFDGNSTDGTLEIIKAIRDNEPDGHKIKLFEKKDPADLRDSYVGMFNECMWSLKTDLAWFLHPDMVLSQMPYSLDHLEGCLAASVKMRSFAGEPGGSLYEIKGRADAWKNIYRLRNPDIGAHYFGHYGSAEEDVYFRDITGNAHEHHGPDFNRYPYEVDSSGIEVLHFSDVRPYERRLGRMKTCLENQGMPKSQIHDKAVNHPRVTLKDGQGFRFEPSEWPAEFVEARNKYRHLERELVKA